MTSAMSKTPETDELDKALRRRLRLGVGIVVLLGASIAGWAANASLTGAVIAAGQMVVDSSDKKVQHPSGGVVGAIMVRNGDRVTAGDIVLKLDETQARANLGIVTSQLVQLGGRKARLEAEREDAADMRLPVGFEASDPEAPAVAAGERRLFEARREGKKGQKAQLGERVGQLKKEIEGLEAQRVAKDIEIKLMKEELGRVEELRKGDLVTKQRWLQTQRDLTRLQGENGVLVAQIAKAKGQISETQLQIINLDQTMQTDAAKELREVEARIAELMERRTAAQDQLKRIDLKAPQSGIVHELNVHTVGGVINAGEVVMTIVPQDDALAIEAKVAQADRDQIVQGQKTKLRFSSFNQSTTPELQGIVTRIAPELTREKDTGAAYYVVRVKVADQDQATAAQMPLVPGTPVDVFVETSSRSALSYIVKPVTDQFARVFRESDMTPTQTMQPVRLVK